MNIDNDYCDGPGCASEMCSRHWVLEFRERRGPHMLYWQTEPEGRWQVDGRGIHAGSVLEMRLRDGTWARVRVESSNAGKSLIAYYDRLSLSEVTIAARIGHRGKSPTVTHEAGTLERFDVTTRIYPRDDQLRWPEEVR